MNFDSGTSALLKLLDSWIHIEWVSIAITTAVTLAITALVAHIVTLLIKRFLHSKTTPIPSSSIFVNIGRVCVWTIGICDILASCFGVNVSAAVTALGIGGIAISLGFQDTLSNLIGGLQISLSGLVEPGDHIKVGSNEGIVHDVTWRHTSILTTAGQNVIIPNSVINTAALIKLPPLETVRIGIIVAPGGGQTLEEKADAMEKAATSALTEKTVLEKPVKVQFYETTDHGFKGIMTFAVPEGAEVGDMKDAALKAVAEYAHGSKMPKLAVSESVLGTIAKRKHLFGLFEHGKHNEDGGKAEKPAAGAKTKHAAAEKPTTDKATQKTQGEKS